MVDESSQEHREHGRNWAIRLAPFVAGSVAGVLFGFRALSIWESGGPHNRVPTGGLVYLGSIFLLGGLMQLHPGLWRGSHDANIKLLRTSWGRGLGRDSRRGRVVLPLQGWLVRREEQERDLPGRRYRAATVGITAGATVILTALLR